MLIRGKLKNSIIEQILGFKGIATDIDPILLPDGFLSEMENLTVTNQATLSSILAPLLIGFPSGLTTDPIISIFKWKRDVAGTSLLMVQAGAKLYSYNGTTFTLIKTFTTTDRASFSGGFFDKLYIMHWKDGFFSFDGTNFTTVSEAPRSKYLLLWQTYLFGGGDLYENKTTAPTDYTYAPFRVRWSGIIDDKFESWYESGTNPAGETVNNFIDMRTPESSNITGMGVWNRRIIIFTEDSIEEIVGSSPSNFIVNTIYRGRLTTINNNVGYYDFVYYVSPEGLCILASQDILISKAYQKYWKTAPYYGIGIYDGKVYFMNGEDLGMFNTQTKFFEHYKYPLTSALYSSKDDLYLGTSDGKIYEWKGETTYLPWSLKTKKIHYGSLKKYKRPVLLSITHNLSAASSTVTVKLILDGVSNTVGTFDASLKTIDEFILSYDVFKVAQVELSGTGEVEIIGIELMSKIRGVGYV